MSRSRRMQGDRTERRGMAFAIKAGISDLRAKAFIFTAQKALGGLFRLALGVHAGVQR